MERSQGNSLPEPELSKARAKALLSELWAGYRSHDFQHELEQLMQKAGDGLLVVEQLHGRRELALGVQQEVLPRYGFAGKHFSMKVVADAVQPYLDDDEIRHQVNTIHVALRLPQRKSSKRSHEDGPSKSPELTKARAVALLSELLVGYSGHRFQQQLGVLVDTAIAAGQKDLASIAGRHELALTVQREVLPRYGFKADSEGVRSMSRALQPLLSDPVVAARAAAAQRKLRLRVPVTCRAASPAASPEPGPRRRPKELPTGPLTERRQRLCSRNASPAPSSPAHRTVVEPQEAAAPAVAADPRTALSLLAAVRAHVFQESRSELLLEGAIRRRNFDEVYGDENQTPGPRQTCLFELNLVPGLVQLSCAAMTEVLPCFGFAADARGWSQMWQWLLKVAGQEPPVAARLDELRTEILALASGGGIHSHISTRWALELFNELLVAYSAPQIQAELNRLRRNYDRNEQQFGVQLKTLMCQVESIVLPRHGFEVSALGTAAMLSALGPVLADQDVQVLAAAVDEAIYGSEVSHHTRLTKRQALKMLREQLGAFSSDEFQAKVRSTVKNGGKDEQSLLRAQLTLSVQCKILPRFGFEADRRGVQTMLAECAIYAMDPQVARLADAINQRLSADKEAKNLSQRLVEVAEAFFTQKSLKQPTPSAAQPKTGDCMLRMGYFSDADALSAQMCMLRETVRPRASFSCGR